MYSHYSKKILTKDYKRIQSLKYDIAGFNIKISKLTREVLEDYVAKEDKVMIDEAQPTTVDEVETQPKATPKKAAEANCSSTNVSQKATDVPSTTGVVIEDALTVPRVTYTVDEANTSSISTAVQVDKSIPK